MNKKIKIILFSIFCFVLLFSPIFLVNKGSNSKLNKNQNNDNVKILKDVAKKYQYLLQPPKGHITIFSSSIFGLVYGFVSEDKEGTNHLYMFGDDNSDQIIEGNDNSDQIIKANKVSITILTPGLDTPDKPGSSVTLAASELTLRSDLKVKNLKIDFDSGFAVVENETTKTDHLWTWGVDTSTPKELKETTDNKPLFPDGTKIKNFNQSNLSGDWWIITEDKEKIDHFYSFSKNDDGSILLPVAEIKVDGSKITYVSNLVYPSTNKSPLFVVANGESNNLYYFNTVNLKLVKINIPELENPGSKITNISRDGHLIVVNNGKDNLDYLYEIAHPEINDQVVLIKKPENSKIVKISSSLGVYGAVLESGDVDTLYMWGHNGYGQFGNGTGGSSEWDKTEEGIFWDSYTQKEHSVPKKIESLKKGKKIKQLEVGESSFAVVETTSEDEKTVSDSLYAWGNNTVGQLGNSNLTFGSALQKNDESNKVNWKPNQLIFTPSRIKNQNNLEIKISLSNFNLANNGGIALVGDAGEPKNLYMWGDANSGYEPKPLMKQPVDSIFDLKTDVMSFDQHQHLIYTSLHTVFDFPLDALLGANTSFFVIEDEVTATDQFYIASDRTAVNFFDTSFAWKFASKPPSGHNGGNDFVLDGHLGKVDSGGFFAKWKHIYIYIIIDSFLLIIAIMLMIAFGSLLYKSKK